MADIDAQLGGGFPRGQLSELVGARSSGRTTVLHALLAAATRRGELVGLVDSLDTFDPPSAAEAGVDLDRMLWVHHSPLTADPGLPRGDLLHSACERALKAFNLILQAGGSSGASLPVLAVLDLADLPAPVLRRIPFITWLRLQRVIKEAKAWVFCSPTRASAAAHAASRCRSPRRPQPRPPQTSPWQMPPFMFESSAIGSHTRHLRTL